MFQLGSFLADYQAIVQTVTAWALEWGYLGGFLVSLGETVILPLFPDPFILGAEAVGLGAWLMVGVICAGTILGAALGYALGSWLGHPVATRLFGKSNYTKAEKLMDKYGVWAVIITGFTPIPFKISVWLAGILEMPFGKFMLAVIIGRVPRFVLVALAAHSLFEFFSL